MLDTRHRAPTPPQAFESPVPRRSRDGDTAREPGEPSHAEVETLYLRPAQVATLPMEPAHQQNRELHRLFTARSIRTTTTAVASHPTLLQSNDMRPTGPAPRRCLP